MSVQSEIQRLNDNVGAAYAAVEEKGGTLPSSLNSENLSSAIRTISGADSVYVGTEEPTEGDKLVWINPEGEVSGDYATQDWVKEYIKQ
jgi:hypothetical protein